MKHFKAHFGTCIVLLLTSGVITDISVTADGRWLASCGADNTLKVFDVLAFDMVNIIKLNATPSVCEAYISPATSQLMIAVYVSHIH